MNLIIIRNNRVSSPGNVYAKKTKKGFFEIMSDQYKIHSKKTYYEQIKDGFTCDHPIIKTISRYIQQDEHNINIASLSNSIGEDNSLMSKVLPRSNIINKNTIVKAGVCYDNEIFGGVFKDKKQYSYIINNLPTDDSPIFITDLEEINKFHDKEIHDVGVYVQYKNNLYKSNLFSESVWDNLKIGIVSVFSALNATSISLKEELITESDFDVSLGKELAVFAPSVGLNLKIKKSFEFECELNGVLDLAEANKNLCLLDDFSGLRILAERNLKNPGMLKHIKQEIELNISFGLNLKVLSALQGTFEGGYTRKLVCNIGFKDV